MKLLLACGQCMRDNIESMSLGFVEPNSEGFYKFTCSKGHESFHVPQEADFEILFEIGCYAILDGYYREAISSYSAALERFYEFYIEIICRRHRVEKELFDEVWKSVSKQSERQLGAFIFLWLTENNQKPDILTDTEKNLRNDVIHKGKIPTKKEATIYGQRVLSLISKRIVEIVENYNHELNKTIRDLQIARNAKVPVNAIRTSGVQGFTLNFTSSDHKKDYNLDVELERINRERINIFEGKNL